MDKPAVVLAILSAGIFFLSGLLTGVWKYLAIMSSPKARASYYVDIAHRASLMYSFAAILLAVFAYLSVWTDAVNFWATLAQVVFFGAAIGTYIAHGALGDTNNQLRSPHRLGKATLPGFLIQGFMWALIVGEVGGFVVLFAGAIKVLPLTIPL